MKQVFKVFLLALLAFGAMLTWNSCARMKEDLTELSETRPIMK